MRVAATLLCLAGCDVFFPLEAPSALPVDAPDVCPVSPDPVCGVGDHDEDDDGTPDACDPCPQHSAMNGGDADDDSDGIGNACDLDRDVAAACLSRRFFSFETGAGWESTAGWTFDDSAGSASQQLAVLRSSEIRGRGRIEALIDDRERTDNHTQDDLLIGVSLLDDGKRGYFCALHPAIGGAVGTLIVGTLVGDRENVLMESDSFGQTPGRSHRIQLTVRSDGTVTCASFGPTDNTAEAGLQLEGQLPPPAGTFGLVLRGTQANFQYVDFVPE